MKKNPRTKQHLLINLAAIMTELVPMNSDPENDSLIDIIVSYLQTIHHYRKKYITQHTRIVIASLATNVLVDEYGNTPNIISYAKPEIQSRFCEVCTMAEVEARLGHKTTIFQKEFWNTVRQIAVEVNESSQDK